MGDLGPVLAAIAVTIIGAIGTAFSARRLRRFGLGDDQAKVNVALRELADVWEEKYNLEHEVRVNAETALANVKADQTIERKLAAQDRQDLDDARSQIRLLERRRQPRTPA